MTEGSYLPANFKCNFIWRGLTPYLEALQLQMELWQKVKDDSTKGELNGYILALEHPSVITLGKRGNANADLSPLMAESQIPIVQIDRGGQATLHSPGQLVIYPILPLAALNFPILKLVTVLHKVTQKSLMRFQVKSQFPQNVGLFTERGKIAFTGMRVEGGVSRHGMSLNISNDLTLFQNIRSCGVNNANLDKLENYLNPPPTPEEFFRLWGKDWWSLVSTTNEDWSSLLDSNQ